MSETTSQEPIIPLLTEEECKLALAMQQAEDALIEKYAKEYQRRYAEAQHGWIGTLNALYKTFGYRDESSNYGFHRWLDKQISDRYTPKTNIVYPWGDEDIPLIPDSILKRFHRQSDKKKAEIEATFPLLDRTCPNGRYILSKPTETDREGLRDLAEKQQITSALSFYDFYKAHRDKNDLPDMLPDTLLFDLLQVQENRATNKDSISDTVNTVLEKHRKILQRDMGTEEDSKRLELFDQASDQIKVLYTQETTLPINQLVKKLIAIEQEHSLPRPFNLEWMSERFREFARGERSYESVQPYEKCITNAYVYFDPHSPNQTFDSLISDYISANTTSKNQGEKARWWVIKDTKTGKIAGAFRYEGDEFDIGICSNDDYRGFGLIGAAIIETGIDIYRSNPGAFERSTYHNTNSNSPFVLAKGGYDDILEMRTIKKHAKGHYYNEPRMITDRYIDTFYGSSSFIKRTFNYLDIIASFEDAEISKAERLKLRKLGGHLKRQAEILPGDNRKELSVLNNRKNAELLFSIADKIKKNHPDFVDNIYGLYLSHLMRFLHVRNPQTILRLLNHERPIGSELPVDPVKVCSVWQQCKENANRTSR